MNAVGLLTGIRAEGVGGGQGDGEMATRGVGVAGMLGRGVAAVAEVPGPRGGGGVGGVREGDGEGGRAGGLVLREVYHQGRGQVRYLAAAHIRHPAGAVRGVGTRHGKLERVGRRPPQLPAGRGEQHELAAGAVHYPAGAVRRVHRFAVSQGGTRIGPLGRAPQQASLRRDMDQPVTGVHRPARAVGRVHGEATYVEAWGGAPQLHSLLREMHHLGGGRVGHPAGAIGRVHREGPRVSEDAGGGAEQLRPVVRDVHHLLGPVVKHPAGVIGAVLGEVARVGEGARADRHNSAPSCDNSTSTPGPRSPTQQQPLPEIETGPRNSLPADRQTPCRRRRGAPPGCDSRSLRPASKNRPTGSRRGKRGNRTERGRPATGGPRPTRGAEPIPPRPANTSRPSDSQRDRLPEGSRRKATARCRPRKYAGPGRRRRLPPSRTRRPG